MSQPKPIGLSEFIYQVKKDLLDKQFTADDPVPLFAIDQVEVEVGVMATREGSGGLKGGINLSIIGLGGAEAELGGKFSKENAQTVRVTLSPLLSKEQLLARMPPEQRERVMQQAEEAIARGSEEPVVPTEA